MRSKTTLAQVAALSGFSTATVSRAFAHPELLNEETLRAINDAAVILRYKIPDSNEEIGSEKRIGVFVNLFNDAGEIEILRGIANALRAWNFELVLYESLDHDRELLETRKIAARAELSAAIFIGAPENPASIPILHSADIATVIVDSQTSQFSRVYSPVESAVDVVFEFFVKSKVKSLLFVGELPQGSERKEALILSRIRNLNRPKNTMVISEFLIELGRAPGPIDLIPTITSESPDAIFAASDSLALEVYRDCLKMGFVVGSDIQIIGFGDGDLAQRLNLSSVSVFLDAQGRRAAEIIYSQLFNPEIGQEVRQEIIQPQLILRGSTKSLM
jgi:LacI family transcriptional regulator